MFVEFKVRIDNKGTIKNGVALWDGVVLEDCVFVGPNAVFTNDKNPRIASNKNPEKFLPTIVRKAPQTGQMSRLFAVSRSAGTHLSGREPLLHETFQTMRSSLGIRHARRVTCANAEKKFVLTLLAPAGDCFPFRKDA